MQKIKKIVSRIWPKAIVKISPREFWVISQLKPDAIVCEIGSGNRRLSQFIINIDAIKQDNVDVICDAHHLPFREEMFDCVFIIAVLEHVKKPWEVANEIYRISKNGGLVYADVPFLQPFHSSPTDYFRFTLPGIKELFEKFKEIESGVSVGPASTVSWIISEFAGSFTDNKYLAYLLKFIVGWLMFPLKYLDRFFLRKKRASNVASGVFFLGKKITSTKFVN